MAIVKAQLNNVRLAPRKVRAVVNMIKGKDVAIAIDQAYALIRRPSDPIIKLLRSAVSNATNNFDMIASNLYVKEFYVDEGVKLKRYRPKGFGRAGEIQKKTSHIRVVLAERVVGLKGEAKQAKHEHAHTESAPTESAMKAKNEARPQIKKELGKKDGAKVTATRRLFQRKSV